MQNTHLNYGSNVHANDKPNHLNYNSGVNNLNYTAGIESIVEDVNEMDEEDRKNIKEIINDNV